MYLVDKIKEDIWIIRLAKDRSNVQKREGKMGDKKQRRFLTPINTYQEEIIFVVFIPAAVIFLALVFSIFLVRREIIQHSSLGNPIDISSAYMQLAFRWHNYIIWGLCGIFIFSVVSAFILSKNLVEVFPRIISELDDIIALRSKKLITVRPSDKLATELLKRVNVLIKFYIENKK